MNLFVGPSVRQSIRPSVRPWVGRSHTSLNHTKMRVYGLVLLYVRQIATLKAIAPGELRNETGKKHFLTWLWRCVLTFSLSARAIV